MDNFKFDMPKLELMVGSSKDSTFTVFAKAANLKMGIRAFPVPYKHDEKVWAAIAIRLRVETVDGSSCSKEMATDAFGQFSFYDSNVHSSAVMVLPLITLPASPCEVFGAYSALDGLESALVDQLKVKFTKAVKFTITKEVLVSILQEAITDFIPEVSPTAYGQTDFIVIDENGKGVM